MVCGGCPSSWEARTPDGKEFYARYRWGSWYMTIDDQTIAQGEAGDPYSGVCGWEDLLAWAADQVTIAVHNWKTPPMSEEDYDTQGLFSKLLEQEKEGQDG